MGEETNHLLLGDGLCHVEFLNITCYYDFGDCCPASDLVGNGICNDETNIEICNYDGGDCCLSNLNTTYCSECGCYHNETCTFGFHPLVGNGFCNNETNIAECNYDEEECCGPDVSCMWFYS